MGQESPRALLRGIGFSSVWCKDEVKIPRDGRFREPTTRPPVNEESTPHLSEQQKDVSLIY